MGNKDQRRGLADRRNPTFDRVVVVCNATGNTLALVQAAGKGPARLMTETGDVLLHSAPNGTTARCRCSAGQHAIDVYRLQTEVYRQDNDPSVRRPVRFAV